MSEPAGSGYRSLNPQADTRQRKDQSYPPRHRAIGQDHEDGEHDEDCSEQSDAVSSAADHVPIHLAPFNYRGSVP